MIPALIDVFLDSGIPSRLLVLTLGAAIKGSALLLLAWAAVRRFRSAAASMRHLIWTAGLGGVLVMPVLSFVTPRLEVLPVARIADVSTPHAAVASSARPLTAITLPEVAAADVSVQRVDVAPPAAAAPERAFTAAELWRRLPLLWISVALLVLARLALGTVRLSSWSRRAYAVWDGEWLSLVRRLSARLGIERPVSLLRSHRVGVPMTWGVVYPVVLLPPDADEWRDDRRAVVLLHELAHIQRFDALTQLIAQLAIAIFWFNPLVWYAARQMRVERERACDDIVLGCGARASDYAEDLLQIARRLGSMSPATGVAALAMARRGELEGRLLAILDPSMRRHGVSRGRTVATCLAVVACAVPLAALTTSRTAEARQIPTVVAGPPSLPVTPVTPIAPTPPVVISPVTATPTIATPVVALPSVAATRAVPSGVTAPVVIRTATVPPPGAPLLEPDKETLIAVARQAAKMTSDNDKAELLIAIAKHYTPDDELRTAYLDAVATIHSSYERTRTLLPLLLKDDLPPAAIGQVVKIATSMTSDNDKANLLVRVLADTAGPTPAMRDAIISAAGTVGSDYDRGRIIAALARSPSLTNRQLADLFAVVKRMSSSYEKANALILLSKRFSLADKTVRDAFLDAAESVSSATDYRRVMTTFLR